MAAATREIARLSFDGNRTTAAVATAAAEIRAAI